MDGHLLKQHIDRRIDEQQTKIRKTHEKKIKNLSGGNVSIETPNSEKTVHNVLSRELTKDEESILSKGLEFCVDTRITDTVEFKTEIELMAYNILKQLDEPNKKTLDKRLANGVRKVAYQFLKMNKQKKLINVSPNEIQALRSLSKDKSIVVMKADKGNACVVMDKEQYKQKVEELLAQGNTFTKMEDQDGKGNKITLSYIVSKMEKKLNYRIGELKKSKKIDQETYDRLYASGTRCAVMFCQPKIHKKGLPLRPIISTTNTYNYQLAKYLSGLIEAARSTPRTFIKDSFDFAKLIQQRKASMNELMFSLDVESLFTNVPVNEAIDLAINIIMKKKGENAKFTNLDVKDLKHLFELAITNVPFRFLDQLYIQRDGVSMGSPLAPILADIFMEHIENKVEQYPEQHRIKIMKRYVDDMFFMIDGKHDDIEKLLEWFNQLHYKIKFTCENEKNYELPFLDVKIIRQRTRYETTIYKKPTHTGLYLHWMSCQARKYKIGLIKTLTIRAIRICSSTKLLKEECEHIEQCLIRNGYPKNLIKRKIKYTIEQKQQQVPTKIRSKLFYTSLTYFGNETKVMADKLKKKLEKTFPTTEVKFGFQKGLTVRKMFIKNYK
ncbi:unnamed protein product, partial [Didymodactylos carnosus]